MIRKLQYEDSQMYASLRKYLLQGGQKTHSTTNNSSRKNALVLEGRERGKHQLQARLKQ